MTVIDNVTPTGALSAETVGEWVPVERARELESQIARERELRVQAQETVARLRNEDIERNAAAREWADDNDLCHQFEAFCESYGWEGRTNDMDVTVIVSVAVPLTVGDVPRDEQFADDLADRIDHQMIVDLLEDVSSDAIREFRVAEYSRAS
ncbi:hypothetical protein GOEFS_109_00010 [Gordonia effusa NBRC 100432]|uniref:Uncharacterized protein n=1 Tax=Gordonia effusa NBRC 100432 TaxID=1077974 RepID=H0R5A5_9ACTN|nr:hypothetical protein [Gordonia effusa]GAB20256.1 hypothetical protein GOEFS_109_00010 [Gordonia effusa NBRC 100432]